MKHKLLCVDLLGQFEVFCLADAARCTDGGGVKFGMENSFMPNFTLSVQGWRVGPKKTELLNFPHISEYEPMGISLARLFKTFNTLWKYSCSIVFKICELR